MVYGKSPSMPVTPAAPIGMSDPPTTPDLAATWGVEGGGWGVGGFSEPFFVDCPKGEWGTVFGSLSTTGLGGSATGSGIVSFWGAGAGGWGVRAIGVGGATVAGANPIFSVDISCGA